MTLLEALAAVLLVAGSALVFFALWAAEAADPAPAEAQLSVRQEDPPLRRAA